MKHEDIFSLQGKLAVVTGGAGLIGKALVEGLAKAGAITILADIDKNKGEDFIKGFASERLNIDFCKIDITKEGSVKNLINLIDKKYKRIAIWVNSAYPRTKDWEVKFERVSLTSWKKNIDMHLNGYFLCSQKIAEYMKKRKTGSIINIASIYGLLAPDFSIYKKTKMTMPVAYSAIKAAIINFTKYLASYYGKYNVRINCISPGGIFNRQPKIFVKKYIEKTPLKRMANAEDILGAAVFLASDASRYITGQNIIIDGGRSLI